jgi:hypothetical protein
MPTSSIVNGTLSVKIKGFDMPGTLKFPAKSYHCKFTIALSLFRLKNGTG